MTKKPNLLKKKLPWYCLGVLLIPVILEIILFWQFRPFYYSINPEDLQPQFLKDYLLEQRLEKIPLEEKIGYLFIVGFLGEQLDEKTAQFIDDHHFQNFILFSSNIRSEPQLKSLTSALCQGRAFTSQITGGKNDVKARPLHLIGIDQEGGAVNRVNFSSLDRTAQSVITASSQSFLIANNRGEILKNLGFNMNFAPVSEVIKDQDSYLNLDNRAFLGNVDQVTQLSVAMINGYQQAGIIAVPKHFPGSLGRKAADPHQNLTVLDLNEEELNEDIKPFQKLINSGKIQAIMVTHILYPKLNEKMRPATFSTYINNDLLRRKLGFKGLIITDDLAMKAIADRYEASEAAKLAIQAGADLLIISGDAARQDQAYQGLLQAVKEGEIPLKRINQSLGRLFKLFQLD